MRRKRAAWICVLLVVAAYLPVSPARAASISVTTTTDEFGSGAKCSLREAVQAANQDTAFGGCPAGSGADTIRLKTGTYRLTREGEDDDNTNGDLDVLSNLTIVGSQMDATIINAEGGLLGIAALHVADGVTLHIKGLTVRGGRPDTPVNGGGILAGVGVVLKLTEVDVAANQAESDGGGIHVESGEVTLRRSTVRGNVAQSNGGGINLETGEMLVVDSTIHNNTVPGFNGGGIDLESDASLNLVRSRVTNNTANGNGGGIYGSTNAPITATDSTIADNAAGSTGGGIRSVAHLELNHSTVSNNHAVGQGGGAAVFGSALMSDSTISGNRANGTGGGLFVTPSNGAEIRSVTITDNMADAESNGAGDAGGIHVEGTVVIANVLIAGNHDDGDEFPDCFGGFTSEGHNLIGRWDDVCGTSQETDLLGTGPPIFPQLGPLEMNGGYTETHSLLPGSEAIGSGNPGTPGDNHPACPALDQRGAPREDCDIGAYQLVTCFGRTVNVVGTNGNDKFTGTNDAEVFLMLDGNDTVNGGNGFDAACGGDGNDKLKGGGDPDKLSGGSGTDTLNGGPANDVCVGGGGQDSATSCEKKQSI